jgi:hypothetical protein
MPYLGKAQFQNEKITPSIFLAPKIQALSYCNTNAFLLFPLTTLSPYRSRSDDSIDAHSSRSLCPLFKIAIELIKAICRLLIDAS